MKKDIWKPVGVVEVVALILVPIVVVVLRREAGHMKKIIGNDYNFGCCDEYFYQDDNQLSLDFFRSL